MENRRYKIIRVALIAITVLFFIFLVNKKFVRWGNFNVDYDFSYPFHPFISPLRPDDRMREIKSENGIFYRGIKGEPVYFDIEAPRNFKNVDLEITYKTNNTKDFKVGVLMDKKNWQYKLAPLENKKMEDLLKSWKFIKEDGVILLERSKKFADVSEFLNNLPARDKIAIYNYDLKNNLIIPYYKPEKGLKTLNNRLKGYHQFYTYIKGEPMDFTFYFERDDHGKSGEINIYYFSAKENDKEFAGREVLADDADVIKIYKENLEEGVYKIEVKLDDKTFIKKIETSQKYLTFINKVNLADNADKESKAQLYTNSKETRFSTSDSSALQDIIIGDAEVKIDDLYKQFSVVNYSCENFNKLNCITELKFFKSSLMAQGDGLFSFSPESFLNPEFRKIESIADLNNIDYVIAGYNIPEEDNGWKISKVNFNLSGVQRNARKYNFIFSSPWLGDDREIDIKNIRAVFR
ncbi:MAG: hypothetical protein V1860_00160 [bacterium]